jgi:hypothetical protein
MSRELLGASEKFAKSDRILLLFRGLKTNFGGETLLQS